MKSKHVVILTGAAVVICGVAAVFYAVGIFNNNRHDAHQLEVRIGSFSTAIDYAPLIIAKEKGFFRDELRKVNPEGAPEPTIEFVTFQTLPSINEALAAGKVDFVFEAEPPAIIGRAAGIELNIIQIGCSLRQEIIVPVDSQIQSIKDLAGHKVAVLAGTSSHYGVLSNAQAEGVPKSDIQILDLVPPDAKATFESGQVDAWAVWPPWVEQELIAGKARVLPGGQAQIHSIVVARSAIVDDNVAVARAVDAAVVRAKKWIEENRQEAMDIVAESLNLPKDVVELAWPKHEWGATLDDAVITDIQAKVDFLKQEGLIRQPVDVRTDLIRQVE